MTNGAFGSVTPCLLDFEVLSYTLSVKYVFALRHDGVFCLIVTESTDVAFLSFREDLGSLASEDQVGVTCHLSHCGSVSSYERS